MIFSGFILFIFMVLGFVRTYYAGKIHEVDSLKIEKKLVNKE